MDINYQNLESLRRMVSMAFKNAFNAHQATLPTSLYTVFPMDTESIVFPFLEQFDSEMREWVGARLVDVISSNSIPFTTKPYEKTYGIKKTDIQDDKVGLYAPIITAAAQAGAQLPVQLITELLNNASGKIWNADGRPFFGSTREFGKGNRIVNLGNQPLTADSLKTTINAMKGYKGSAKRKMGVKPTTLVHGSDLTWTVEDILESPFKADGSGNGNPLYHKVQHVEIEGLEGQSWFLFGECLGIKPIGYFERQRPDQLVAKDNPKDENVFNNNEFLYGVDGRASAAWLFPQLAFYQKVEG